MINVCEIILNINEMILMKMKNSNINIIILL